ncbi:hypothetical protein DIE11_24205 [Burkholderia sp. Bp9012]|nr:hypothetical protein DIE11_24205 [Burkholderia sp. Bp9012]
MGSAVQAALTACGPGTRGLAGQLRRENDWRAALCVAAPVSRCVAARDPRIVTTPRGTIAYARPVSGDGGCRSRINRVTTDQ